MVHERTETERNPFERNSNPNTDCGEKREREREREVRLRYYWMTFVRVLVTEISIICIFQGNNSFDMTE